MKGPNSLSPSGWWPPRQSGLWWSSQLPASCLPSSFRTSVERNFDARLQSLLDGLLASVELDETGPADQQTPFAGQPVLPALVGLVLAGLAPGRRGHKQSIASESLLEQRLPVEQSLTASRSENGVASYYHARAGRQDLARRRPADPADHGRPGLFHSGDRATKRSSPPMWPSSTAP